LEKLNSRVSYNGITSAFQADDAGSIPATRSSFKQGRGLQRYGLLANQAHIAQLVEHFLGKEEVSGSNPDMSSSFWMKRERVNDRSKADKWLFQVVLW
jgi:hypothetical protein